MDGLFNIRVYGVLINEQNEVLLSHERRNGWSFTKFPGGGMEWGEGPIECLKREFNEEMGIDVEVGELFYLTDYFQLSGFKENEQLISIYYRVYSDVCGQICVNGVSTVGTNIDCEQFHWVPLTELTQKTVTLPIDKIVAEKLMVQLATSEE